MSYEELKAQVRDANTFEERKKLLVDFFKPLHAKNLALLKVHRDVGAAYFNCVRDVMLEKAVMGYLERGRGTSAYESAEDALVSAIERLVTVLGPAGLVDTAKVAISYAYDYVSAVDSEWPGHDAVDGYLCDLCHILEPWCELVRPEDRGWLMGWWPGVEPADEPRDPDEDISKEILLLALLTKDTGRTEYWCKKDYDELYEELYK